MHSSNWQLQPGSDPPSLASLKWVFSVMTFSFPFFSHLQSFLLSLRHLRKSGRCMDIWGDLQLLLSRYFSSSLICFSSFSLFWPPLSFTGGGRMTSRASPGQHVGKETRGWLPWGQEDTPLAGTSWTGLSYVGQEQWLHQSPVPPTSSLEAADPGRAA